VSAWWTFLATFPPHARAPAPRPGAKAAEARPEAEPTPISPPGSVPGGETVAALPREEACRGVVQFGGPSRDPGSGRKVVYLTFDDGPSPYLKSILATLDRAGVRASFFFVGDRVRSEAGLVRAAFAAGDAIGNHSWDHALFVRLRPADQRQEVERTNEVLRQVLGFAPSAFRPPYGGYDATTCELMRSLGMKMMLWDEDPRDWSLHAGQEALLVRHVEEHLFPGAVVDLHENVLTARALPELISRLRALGYEIRPLPLGAPHGEGGTASGLSAPSTNVTASGR
jgi:peptidoglycan/xylan/chitin deacetylase (PgdA/CDA1 family)